MKKPEPVAGDPIFSSRVAEFLYRFHFFRDRGWGVRGFRVFYDDGSTQHFCWER